MGQEMDGVLLNNASGQGCVFGDEHIMIGRPGIFQIQELADMAAARGGQTKAQLSLAAGAAGLHVILQVDHIHKAPAPKTAKELFCPICKQRASGPCLNG
jgi:hypothetical protein